MTASGARLVEDSAELSAHYGDDPAHIYARVDLEEPFWSSSRWYRRGDGVVGLVCLPGTDDTVVYAVATIAVDETHALLADLAGELPSGTFVTGSIGLADALADRGVAWADTYVKYLLADGVAHEPPDLGVVPLGRSHETELRRLYDAGDVSSFAGSMLDDDSFAGVFHGDELIAAAGTHVLSDTQRIAAIGAVCTHPDHRGRGLGAAVTKGVIDRIDDRVDDIALNVAASNLAARRVYERLGFIPLLDYEEAGLA